VNHYREVVSVFISIVILFSLCSFSSLPSVKGQNESTIIGYGPIGGDLVMPYAGSYADGIVYIADIFGISLFEAETGTFIRRFPVESPMYKDLQLVDSLRMISSIFGNGPVINPGQYTPQENITIKPSLQILSTNECVIVEDAKSLSVYSLVEGKKVRSIPIPEFSSPHEESSVQSMYCVVDDQLNILSLEKYSTGEDHTTETQLELFVLDNKGDVLQSFVIEDTQLSSDPYPTLISFSVSPDRSKIAFCSIDTVCITDAEGKVLLEYNYEEKEEALQFTSFFNNDTLYASGLNIDGLMSMKGCQIIPWKIVEEDDKLSLDKQKPLKIKDTGFFPAFLDVKNETVTWITLGMMEDLFQYRTFCIQNESAIRIGSYPSQEGQICGSSAFAIDENHWLYETSLGQDMINVFNEKGEFVKQIPIDIEVVSSIMNMVNFMPLMLDMEIEDEYLYLSNAFLLTSLSICRYSLETEEWELLYVSDIMSDSSLLFSTSIEVFDEIVYVLCTDEEEGKYPVVYAIDSWGDIVEEYYFTFESSDYEPEQNPFWLDFCYDTEEELFYFLDADNRTFLVFDSDADLMEVIPLKTKDYETEVWGVFSSFVLREDTFIVTDVMADKIYEFDTYGNVLQSYGKRGTIQPAINKEYYQLHPDLFYGAWKVRMAKNHSTKNDPIYVSDFGNFRYHKIMLTEAKKPVPTFPTISLFHEKFSVFETKSFTIPCTVDPTDGEFSYTLSSDVPWISFPQPKGVYPSDRMIYEIDGSKLQCWELNKANITISFPDLQPDSRIIDVSVEAVGNKIVVQIGSEVALLNDTIEIPLDKGSIPAIFQGRTYVAIRFLSEKVFEAEVEWNAEDRSVTFTKGDFVVTLFVGKKIAIVNGKEISIDAPPIIVEGRTLVPLRFISENLGASVEWEAETQKVTIYYPAKTIK